MLTPRQHVQAVEQLGVRQEDQLSWRSFLQRIRKVLADSSRQNKCPEWWGPFVLLLRVTTSNKGNHEQRKTGISAAVSQQRKLVQGTLAGGAPAGHGQDQGVVRGTGG